MKIKIFIIIFLALGIFPNLLFAQFTQQGLKLVGTNSVGNSNQGNSVAISSDGNTAIVGGPFDNNHTGAVWVFIRSGGVWTQQGSKLVGTGAVGNPVEQGHSVAISSDGNTIVIGGYYDNVGVGAVWVFTRSGGVWTQQGSKLVGTGYGTYPYQGSSVAISADGNTIIEGGDDDNNAIGAIWIFTRTGGVWTQQGTKLLGTGAINNATQGCSVSISADGNTAIEGGLNDNNFAGALWVFTRSGGVWIQQGSKLVGIGAVGNANQGCSASISSDGNTLIEGGYADNNNIGAIWVFTRSGGFWTQQGPKLVGSGLLSLTVFGGSVSVSPDGNNAIVGGVGDNNYAGAIWAFTRNGGVWTQLGPKIVGTGAVGSARQGASVAISSNGTVIEGGTNDNNIGASWVFVNPSIGITPISTEIPKDFSLSQNYPNPFNPSTKFELRIAKFGFVKVTVYDVLGRVAAVLVNENLKPGTYNVDWNAANYSSGIYFYKMTAVNFTETKKMMLLK